MKKIDISEYSTPNECSLVYKGRKITVYGGAYAPSYLPFRHQLDLFRFFGICHQLLCVDTVDLDGLGAEAIGSLAAYAEPFQASGIVGVSYPLMDRFPFKLGEHNTDIQHSPPHWGRSIRLFRRGHKLHVVLLQYSRRIRLFACFLCAGVMR